MAFQMQFFMFLSGYCACFALPMTDMGGFLKKKIKGLLIPYVSWVTILILLGLLRRQYVVSPLVLKEYFISGFWYLRTLFYIFLALMVQQYFQKLLKNRFSISWIISWVLTYLVGRIPGCGSLWKYYMWFTLGICANHAFARIHSGRLIYVEEGCYIGGAMSIFGFLCLDNALIQAFADYAVGLFCTLGLFFLCKRIYAAVADTSVTSAMCTIGRKTLGLYAIHWSLLFSTGWGDFSGMMRRFTNSDWLIAFVMLVVWTAVSVLVWILLNRFKWARVCLLGK